MGSFVQNAITKVGNILLAKVQAGAVFEATRIVMGSGYIPAGKTAETMTDVAAPVVTLPINKVMASNDGMVTYGGAYSNKDVAADFYFRELALYARPKNADGTAGDEVLYSYGNFGDTADFMVKYSTSSAVEKQIDLVVWVGNNAAITLEVASGVYIAESRRGAPGGVAALDNSSNINMVNGGTIKNVPIPVEEGDAASRAYVDQSVVTNIPRPNLLDNWFFKKPVNQREATTYQNGYAIDRWKTTGEVLVLAAGLGLRNNYEADPWTLSQNIEGVEPGVYTASVLIASISGTVTIRMEAVNGGETLSSAAITAPGLYHVTGRVAGRGIYKVGLVTSDAAYAEIEAIKLERGDTQTLAYQDADGAWMLTEIPNFAEQLARCHRHYVQFGAAGNIHVGYAVAMSSDAAHGVIYLPEPMRETPTVGMSGKVFLFADNNDAQAVTKVEVLHASANVCHFTLNSGDLVAGRVYAIRPSYGYLDFSAELN